MISRPIPSLGKTLLLDQSRICVVVPAFNEASVLASTLRPLWEAGHAVVVVDDGSSDNTWETLRSLPVFALRHRINLGQGAALQTAMTFAYESGAEVVVHFDADGQHDPAQIAELARPVLEGEVDVVFGCRFLRESDRRLVPARKQLVLKAGIVVSGVLTGVWLHDTHNGFRALSRRALGRIHLRENGFAHATEILQQVRQAGLRYIEAPTTICYSSYSTAKGQPISNAFNIVMDLLLSKLFR